RPSRDRLHRLRADACGRARPGARAHAARREGASRRLRRKGGNGEAGRGNGVTTGGVLARTGSTYRVHAERGEMTAVLRGKLKRKDDDRVVAGDVVELDVRGDGPAAITGVHPRRSLLARRSSGARGPGRRQPIAANVDQVVVVAAARDPEPNFRMLDRLLVIAEANRIPRCWYSTSSSSTARRWSCSAAAA